MNESMSVERIKAEINEFLQLESAIRSNNAQNKKYRERMAVIHISVQEFLQATNSPGFTYKDREFKLNSEPSFSSKKKKDKEADICGELRAAGVDNPEEVYKRIQRASKGDEIIKNGIKVRKIKKKK